MPDVWVLSAWMLLDNGTKVPAVVGAYPSSLGWSDKTSQFDADILMGLDYSVVHGRVSAGQVAALQADVNYPVLSVGEPDSAPDFTAEQVAALRAKIAARLSGDMGAWVTQDTVQPAVIVTRTVEVNTRPPWRSGIIVGIGDIYYYQGNLYRCVQAHSTQSDWTPPITPALWTRFYTEPFPEWVQPAGAQDAYALGATVSHDGHHWRSLYAANVWEPGVFGWEQIN